MKKLFVLFVLFAVLIAPSFMYAQTAYTAPQLYVGTEKMANLAHQGSATGDTITCKFLVGIFFTQPLANDTIVVSNGATATLATFQWGTVPPIFYAPFDCKITSGTLWITKKTAGKMTTVYRTAY